MHVVNDSREKAVPGSGGHVARGGLAKGGVAAVTGDTLSCDFKVTNTSSDMAIPGAKLHAGTRSPCVSTPTYTSYFLCVALVWRMWRLLNNWVSS
jgi:hypothetical protein